MFINMVFANTACQTNKKNRVPTKYYSKSSYNGGIAPRFTTNSRESLLPPPSSPAHDDLSDNMPHPAIIIGLAVISLDIFLTSLASFASAKTPQSTLYRSSLLKSKIDAPLKYKPDRIQQGITAQPAFAFRDISATYLLASLHAWMETRKLDSTTSSCMFLKSSTRYSKLDSGVRF
mmetsp:Transcript_21425/g.31620  ORF Transcript_21425/g.31620 Transcript_21425/m.31620 type:complete len:176 (-) Transcript_21425:786-1313(-)